MVLVLPSRPHNRVRKTPTGRWNRWYSTTSDPRSRDHGSSCGSLRYQATRRSCAPVCHIISYHIGKNCNNLTVVSMNKVHATACYRQRGGEREREHGRARGGYCCWYQIWNCYRRGVPSPHQGPHTRTRTHAHTRIRAHTLALSLNKCCVIVPYVRTLRIPALARASRDSLVHGASVFCRRPLVPSFRRVVGARLHEVDCFVLGDR